MQAWLWDFYPENEDCFYSKIGEGPDVGQCDDADYLVVWDHILLPITEEFDTVAGSVVYF